ncbi:hypothetical protein IEQ34_019909 [Dendrobium chrysotoxum]|uniref:Uncharacterized protein n=1 Tax=Dendrobium chrysotoxum TaxID=161865 RepID=A0AAV7FSJ0_DENCH|nr:hypothetical protein IEQ34_019909 [Dendrobium chrysotoxum]
MESSVCLIHPLRSQIRSSREVQLSLFVRIASSVPESKSDIAARDLGFAATINLAVAVIVAVAATLYLNVAVTIILALETPPARKLPLISPPICCASPPGGHCQCRVPYDCLRGLRGVGNPPPERMETSNLEVKLLKLHASGEPESNGELKARDDALNDDVQITCFTEDLHDATLHFQIIRFSKQAAMEVPSGSWTVNEFALDIGAASYLAPENLWIGNWAVLEIWTAIVASVYSGTAEGYMLGSFGLIVVVDIVV